MLSYISEADVTRLNAVAESLLHMGHDRAADLIFSALEAEWRCNASEPHGDWAEVFPS